MRSKRGIAVPENQYDYHTINFNKREKHTMKLHNAFKLLKSNVLELFLTESNHMQSQMSF